VILVCLLLFACRSPPPTRPRFSLATRARVRSSTWRSGRASRKKGDAVGVSTTSIDRKFGSSSPPGRVPHHQKRCSATAVNPPDSAGHERLVIEFADKMPFALKILRRTNVRRRALRSGVLTCAPSVTSGRADDAPGIVALIGTRSFQKAGSIPTTAAHHRRVDAYSRKLTRRKCATDKSRDLGFLPSSGHWPKLGYFRARLDGATRFTLDP